MRLDALAEPFTCCPSGVDLSLSARVDSLAAATARANSWSSVRESGFVGRGVWMFVQGGSRDPNLGLGGSVPLIRSALSWLDSKAEAKGCVGGYRVLACRDVASTGSRILRGPTDWATPRLVVDVLSVLIPGLTVGLVVFCPESDMSRRIGQRLIIKEDLAV